jgi:hypothetical protein
MRENMQLPRWKTLTCIGAKRLLRCPVQSLRYEAKQCNICGRTVPSTRNYVSRHGITLGPRHIRTGHFRARIDGVGYEGIPSVGG